MVVGSRVGGLLLKAEPARQRARHGGRLSSAQPWSLGERSAGLVVRLSNPVGGAVTEGLSLT